MPAIVPADSGGLGHACTRGANEELPAPQAATAVPVRIQAPSMSSIGASWTTAQENRDGADSSSRLNVKREKEFLYVRV